MPVPQNGSTILLAEDDLEVRTYLETALRCQGYAVEIAQDGEEALAYLQSSRTPVAAVVMDVIMPRRDGIDALKEIRRFNSDVPVIMMSGTSSPINVVEAMKNGANDFLPKPINPEDLRKALKTAFSRRPPAAGSRDEPAAAPANEKVFVGSSRCMQELQSLIGLIGWSEAPVLIQGETGVGKEVFARELHAHSPRAKRPFLKLNCAALPSELVESELFGYERGAFTGAFQRKPGMFEQADGGTIMLDEIGDMDFKLQAKLLQVLQDHEFQRLGGKGCIKVDVRVIAATHRDLERDIAEERFREDLFYRLNVVSVRVPPLRERRDDIAAMTEFLARKHATAGTAPPPMPPSLQEMFLAYDWPGNIRELENVIRNFLIFRDAKVIERDFHLRLARKPVQRAAPPDQTVATFPPPLEVEGQWADDAGSLNEAGAGVTPVLQQVAQAKREAERSAILTALKSTNWNRRQASALLQIDYKALLYKMKVLSIKRDRAAAPKPVSSELLGRAVGSRN
jgi:two-component system response regulator AtoC